MSGLSKQGLVAGFRRNREQVDRLIREKEDNVDEPGLLGEWSLKDLIAHFCEWDRWTFAQLRSVVTGEPPRYYGDQPSYPQEFYSWIDEDHRNRLILEASHRRSVDETVRDLEAVWDAFLSWFDQADVDLDAAIGIDSRPGLGGDDQVLRFTSEMPAARGARPWGDWLADQIRHAREHLDEVG